MKKEIKPTTIYACDMESVSIREVINFRVWWKPWTWLRRKAYLPYNPPIDLKGWDRGREIEIPRPDIEHNNWDGK